MRGSQFPAFLWDYPTILVKILHVIEYVVLTLDSDYAGPLPSCPPHTVHISVEWYIFTREHTGPMKGKESL